MGLEQIEYSKRQGTDDNDEQEDTVVRKSTSASIVSQINDFRNSLNSSITTIFAIVNMMVGSIVLILPINVQNCGLILSFIIMITIGIISYITCYWIVKNTREDENSIGEVLERILGIKWKNIFLVSSCLLLGLAGIIYSVLVNETTWQIVNFIAQNSGMNPKDFASPKDIDFTKYSMQWQAIILFPLLSPLLFIKKTNFIVKIAGYGSASLYIYIVFIFYLYFQDLVNDTISENMENVNYFTDNLKVIGAVIGNFSLAFNAHNGITKVTSSNKNKSKNVRDFSIAFIIVFLIYGSLGLFGYFGILGRQPVSIKDPEIIYDYFGADNVLSFIVAFIFLIHLVSVYPLLCFISKNQLFSIIYKDKDVPNKAHLIFNLIFAISCLIIQIFLIDINLVIGIAGSGIGFIIVYLVPSLMRIKQHQQKYQLKQNEEYFEQNQNNQYIDSQQNDLNETAASQYLMNTVSKDDYMSTELLNAPQKEEPQVKKIMFYGFIILLNIIGFIFALISLILIFV